MTVQKKRLHDHMMGIHVVLSILDNNITYAIETTTGIPGKVPITGITANRKTGLVLGIYYAMQ